MDAAVRLGVTTAAPSPEVSRRQSEFLLDASRQLAGSLNVRRTVLRALHLAVPFLGDSAVLALFEGRGVALFVADAQGPASEGVLVHRLDENSGLRHIAEVGRTERLHLAGPGAIDGLAGLIPDAGVRQIVGKPGPTDVLGVGLSARGTTVGVLVALREAGRGYDAREVGIAEDFARHVAIGISGARLYEERMRTAATLQESLRPPDLPEVPGLRLAARYRAANEQMDVGGDFYDVHGGPDDLGLVVGDVSGKGIEAAVLTGRARQTIKTAAYFDRSPAKILTALNDVLREDGTGRFITVACLRLRPAPDGPGFTVTIAVAGHPAPLVLRRDGTVERPDVRGTLSGVLSGLSYTEIELRLDPGDALLVYTDGVEEARGREGFFGLERLVQLLPVYAGADPEVLCDAVERRVLDYLGGRDHDDIALLAVGCDR